MPIMRTLPFVDWPPIQRDLYIAASDKYGLQGAGPSSHWSESTHAGVQNRWGAFLEFQRRRGISLEGQLPSELVTLDSLVAFVSALEGDHSTVTMETYVRDLLEAVRVMQPGADSSLLREVLSELTAVAEPATDTLPSRIGPSDLYDAGVRRANLYKDAALLHRGAALAFGDGLLMAVWPNKPVRLKTQVGTLLSNFTRTGGSWDLDYDPNQTKTAAASEAPLPATLTEQIDHWLLVRKKLLDWNGTTSEYFWLNGFGKPFCKGWFSYRFCRATKEELGERVTPHQVRRIAATGIAVHAPEQSEAIPQVLDNTERISRRHYVKTGGVPNNLAYLLLRAARAARRSGPE